MIKTNRKPIIDERGYFIPSAFPLINVSYSKKGTIRGLHYQAPPYEQAKEVLVAKGEISDVVVGLIKGETYSFHLKEGNSILVPEGYAHGFEALEDSIVVYKVSKPWKKEAEGIIKWDSVNYDWKSKDPIMSDKDKYKGVHIQDYLRNKTLMIK